MSEYNEDERTQEILRKLEALKARIPKVDCKGFCFRACAAISMTQAEHQYISYNHGLHILHLPVGMAVEHNMGATCAALENRRCRIHADPKALPALCMAYGSTEHMKCPFGCVPKDGYMSIVEYKLLIAEMEDIGGGWDTTPLDRVRLRQLLSTATGRERYTEHVMNEMAPIEAWWRNYIETNPDKLPLEAGATDGEV